MIDCQKALVSLVAGAHLAHPLLTVMNIEDNSRIGEGPDAAESVAGDFVMGAIDRVCQRIPALEEGDLHSTQSGRDGIAPDRQPILIASNALFYLQLNGSRRT
jgi:hypothetical protein